MKLWVVAKEFATVLSLEKGMRRRFISHFTMPKRFEALPVRCEMANKAKRTGEGHCRATLEAALLAGPTPRASLCFKPHPEVSSSPYEIANRKLHLIPRTYAEPV